jgi:hypothetical protein
MIVIACHQKQASNEPTVLRGIPGNSVFDTSGVAYAVGEVMNTFSKAYNNSDTSGLNNLLSDDFLMITGIADHSFFTRREFLQFITDSKDTTLIDLKSPFNYLPGPRKITVAYTGLAASAQDSVSFLNITKQKMVMNTEHYGAVYLNAFLQKEGSDWKIQFISLYPVLKDETK